MICRPLSCNGANDSLRRYDEPNAAGAQAKARCTLSGGCNGERGSSTAQWQARVRLCFHTITRAPSRSGLQLFSHDRPFAGSGTRLLTRRVMTSAASRVRWRVCVAMYRVCRWLKSCSILDNAWCMTEGRRPGNNDCFHYCFHYLCVLQFFISFICVC